MLRNCAGSSWSGMTRRVIFPLRGHRPLAQSPATLVVVGMVGASASRNVMWKIAADDGSVCVGFALAGDADSRRLSAVP